MGFSQQASNGILNQVKSNFADNFAKAKTGNPLAGFNFISGLLGPIAAAGVKTSKTPGVTPAPVTPALTEPGTVSRRASQRYGQSLASTAAPGLQAPSDTFSLLG